MVEHHRDFELAQRSLARRRELTAAAAPSATSGPAMASSPSARSSALRPNGPITADLAAPPSRRVHGRWAGKGHKWAYARRRRRNARGSDRTADIAAELEPGQPRGKRRRRAARRAAGRAGEVPGIIGGAVDLVVALPVREPDRHVALAEDSRPAPVSRSSASAACLGGSRGIAECPRSSACRPRQRPPSPSSGRHATGPRPCLWRARDRRPRPLACRPEIGGDDGVDRG